MAAVLQDPLSSAAPVLGAGPSALDIGYKRMGMEADAAKLAAAQQVAADKAKAKKDAANAKQTEAKPETVFMPYGMEWNNKTSQLNQKLATMLQAHAEGKGGDPRDPATVEGMEYMAAKQAAAQWADNARQIGVYHAEGRKQIAEDIKSGELSFMPDAMAKWDAVASDPALADKGILPEMPMGIVDVEKSVKDHFGAYADLFEQSAWANTAGTASGTLQTVDEAKLKERAQNLASNPWMQKDIAYRLNDPNLVTPERRAELEKMAKDNKISVTSAYILDEAKALYGHTRETQISEQQSNTGYGREKETAQAREIFEVWKGTVEGTHAKYKDVKGALPDVSDTQFRAILKNNPQLETFFDKNVTGSGVEFSLKPGFSLLKDFNKYTIGKEDEKSTEDGKIYANPVKPVLVIQDDNNKSIMVVSGSDSKIKNGQVRISDPMSPSEVYSKLIVPAALNTKGYDVGALDLYTESQGVNIKGTNANINPSNQPVQLLDRGTGSKNAYPGTPKEETAAERYQRISGGK